MTKPTPLTSRACVECGADFMPTHPRNVACSVECRHERHKQISREHAARKFVPAQPNPERACKRCGEMFTPYRASNAYCGRLCQRLDRQERRWADKPTTRNCHKCGVGGLPKRPGKPVCDSCKLDPRPNAKAREAERRLRTYGLTRAEYDTMWVAQGERCAVCGTTTPNSKGWCIDHDHDTGRVRGILCSRCNTALGLMADSVVLSLRMADYLMQFCRFEGWWGDTPNRDSLTVRKEPA